MSTRGTRGRGVGRGRSRGHGGMDTRRPGEPPRGIPTEGQQQVGRGRGRAAAQIQQKQQSPPTEAKATPQPPTEKMQQMSLQQTQGEAGRRERPSQRRGEISYEEPHTRPEHITDKRGTYGTQVPIIANYVVLKNRPGNAIYQYNVSYNPPVDSKGLRISLFGQQIEALNARVRAFDGMVLYLPHRLPNDVTEVISQTRDGENIHVTVKLTNELSANSPVCLQLFNVLFRRSVYYQFLSMPIFVNLTLEVFHYNKIIDIVLTNIISKFTSDG